MFLFIVKQVFLRMGEVRSMHNIYTQCTMQQREEAKEIPSRKRAQMYITAGSDVGAHVQGQARVWRSYRQTPADSQQENLDSPTTRNWILPTI